MMSVDEIGRWRWCDGGGVMEGEGSRLMTVGEVDYEAQEESHEYEPKGQVAADLTACW
jgi:hypothetical protein